MSRFKNQTMEDSPVGSRGILQAIAQSSPNGRPLNVHAQMANAPIGERTAAVRCADRRQRHYPVGHAESGNHVPGVEPAHTVGEDMHRFLRR